MSWDKARRAEKGVSRPVGSDARKTRGISASMRSSLAKVNDSWTAPLGGRARRGDRVAPGPQQGHHHGVAHGGLDGRQSGAITAVCTDMYRPYLNAVTTVLPQAEIVCDEFDVLQHASAALDEVRPPGIPSRRPVMREHGRGERWLLLRRWETVCGSKPGGTPGAVCRESSVVQSLRALRAAWSALDL